MNNQAQTAAQQQHIVLIIAGGIAAYKAPELARLLIAEGYLVSAVMTQAAHHYVSATVLNALLNGQLYCQGDYHLANQNMAHIELAKTATAFLVLPATANLLAKIANGLADDLATTTLLATTAPVAIMPAMNKAMWQNPAVQQNIQLLSQRGYAIWGPAEGEQACGDVGFGRMIEPKEILCRYQLWLPTFSLKGQKILITAGATQEPLDPIRYLSNRSTGFFGMMMANAAALAGAEVTLITGSVSQNPCALVTWLKVDTAAQMATAVFQAIEQKNYDAFIGLAAVVDYVPTLESPQKIKKKSATLELALIRSTDIIAEVAKSRFRPRLVIGAAAETDNLVENAAKKVENKRLDYIIASQVGKTAGFGDVDTCIIVLDAKGEQVTFSGAKAEISTSLLLKFFRES